MVAVQSGLVLIKKRLKWFHILRLLSPCEIRGGRICQMSELITKIVATCDRMTQE